MKSSLRATWLVASVAGLTVISAAPAAAEIGPGAGASETVTAAPRPTWQTNGTVWAMEIVNNVLYIGGNFTTVRPPGAASGTDETPRTRLAAFDATTGDLLPWAPAATSTPFTYGAGVTPDKNCTPVAGGQYQCANVWSIKANPNKTQLIIGGDFQFIDGKARAGLAAFTTNNGALNTVFKPATSGRVYSVAVSPTTIYAGGSITKAGGQVRNGFAAFDFATNAVLPWAPTMTKGTPQAGQGSVRSIVLNSDYSRLIVGGGFNQLNGTNIHGLGALDSATGANLPWGSSRIVNAAGVTSLMIRDDVVYSTADAGGSESEGIIAFNANTGAEIWYDGCRGASHSVAWVRGVLYAGSHAHDCGTMTNGFPEQYQGYGTTDRRRQKLRAVVPDGSSAALQQWFPQTDDGNGARAMATDQNTLWIAGEFTNVDNTPQQGLTRFSFLDSGGTSHKPMTPEKPIVYSTLPGRVDIQWKATEDPDNTSLEYWVIRDSVTKFPIYKITSADKHWSQKWISFTDTGVNPGESHTYDIRAVDSLGVQSVRSPGVTLTVAAAATPVTQLPKGEGAVAHYSFDALSAGKLVDTVSGRLMTLGAGVNATQPGNGVTGNTGTFSGAANANAVEQANRTYTGRQSSYEMMFKTSSTTGGVLASQGSSSTVTGVSGSNTQSLFMSDNGRLNFGLMPDAPRDTPWTVPSTTRKVVSTSAAYNDNNWHHVAVTFEPGTGTRIYVDGLLAAQDPTMNWTRVVNAYLRVGGDRVSAWPNGSSSANFKGQLDEVAVYQYPLTPDQVTRHANAFRGL